MAEQDSLKDIPEHEEYLEAKDGTQVFMHSWLPQGEITNIVFTVPGLCAHSAMYRKLASALAEDKNPT